MDSRTSAPQVSTADPQISARPGLVMGIGRLVVAGLGMASTPVYTRVLDAREYGSLALIVAIVAFASTVPSQWLNAAALRYGARVGDRELTRSVMVGLLWSLSAIVTLALIGTLATFGLDFRLATLVAVLAASEATFTSLLVTTRVKLKAWAFVVGGVTRNLLSTLFVLILEVAGREPSFGDVVTCMVVASAVGAVAIVAFRPSSGASQSVESVRLRAWLTYGGPLIVNYAFGLGFLYLNRFMLLALAGADEVGRFTPTFDLMFAITTLVVGLVGLTTVPRIFGATDPVERERLFRGLHKAVLGTTVVTATLLLITWPILSVVLIGADLRVTSWGVIAPLACSFAVLAYRFQYQNILIQFQERTTMQTLVTVAALLVNAILNLALIPLWGAAGAASATLAGALVGTALAAAFTRSPSAAAAVPT